METDVKSRQQVSLDQLKALIDFLREHPELAKGLARGRRGKLQALKLWNQCAKKLNLIKDGAAKDRKGWSKYWCDWKYRVRRRTLELKVARDSNRPPPDGVTPLSPLEEDLLSIIGESIEGVMIKGDPLGNGEVHIKVARDSNRPPPDGVTPLSPLEEGLLSIIGESIEGVMIKGDPLGNGDTDEEPENNVNTLVKVASSRRRKRKHSSLDIFDLEERDDKKSSKRKPKIQNEDSNTDTDDEAEKFLQLEKEKLKNLKKIKESIETLASTITQLADVVMTHMRDNYINRKHNL